MSWLEAAIRWYGTIGLLTWALAPGVCWLGNRLADRGVTIARPIAVLVAVYPAWLAASLGAWAFGATQVWATVAMVGALCWGLAIWRRAIDLAWLRAMLCAEAGSALLFAAYVWLRGFTPQILGTEKPMDVAFLASSARSVVMPPPDPWFAGEPINYYYLGYLLHGTLSRLAGAPPEIGFNLALASIFSVTSLAAFGVGWNVSRVWLGRRAAAASGVLTAFLLVFAGNLYAPWRLLQDARATIDAAWWDSAIGIGWRSSRIVCDGPRVGNLCPPPATETINEFPAFSFLLGDLHPHLMALPYTLVAIALAWNLAQYRNAPQADWAICGWLVRVAATGAIVGGLYAMNAWDLPTFLFLTAVGVWAGSGRPLGRALPTLALLAVSAVLPWLPFLLSYVPPTATGTSSLPGLLSAIPVLPRLVSAFAIHVGERTSAVEYLTQFGVPYLCGIALVASGLGNEHDANPNSLRHALYLSVAVTLIPGILLAAPVIPLCGIPLGLAIAQIRADPAISPRQFALVALSAAWILSIGVEIVYIQDLFANRMNTLFKFYYQTWTLYAVATGVGAVLLWDAASTRRRSWQRLTVAACGVIAFAALVGYPAIASYQWTNHFQGWQGLDGLAYGAESDPGDVAAIRWLAQHAEPGDVVLEAAGCAYRPFGRLPFNRVSAFTGVPTIIGWGDNHQRQWRAGESALLDEIPRREEDVRAAYADPNSALIEHYGVDWLYIGEYEVGDWQTECPTAGPYPGLDRAGYPGPGWQEAFRSGQTRIYRRATG